MSATRVPAENVYVEARAKSAAPASDDRYATSERSNTGSYRKIRTA
ncbi:Uncharacterised protein [Mycobacteroides abscessus subsp. abscessus]|nr:Uncharacterised protein [Mycobacteroides abscessus subsp. abscessus]